MGPFDDLGPYAETTITTRKTDADKATDNESHFGHLVIGTLLLGPALWVVVFMGLFCWKYIGPLSAAGLIGLGFWACGHYGTNRSVLDRFRYRTTKAQRETIQRRLSDIKDSGRK
ncbi:MAG: hypothetical protein DRJ03_00875 [Chloroflexi bacterium]|nr:MAG: hypothetical protein DRJ03_00875 [Chloroflexota bacterium]